MNASLLQSDSKTRNVAVIDQFYSDIKSNGEKSAFVKAAPGQMYKPMHMPQPCTHHRPILDFSTLLY